jgi:hypothetical protein
MDDRTPAIVSPPRTYTCPGQLQPIDRALHLARLASFYPACLQCADRHDTAGLTTLQIKTRADVERRATIGCQWSSEGLEWTTGETQHRGMIERVVTALAARLWQQTPAARPTILVGSDGGGAAADLVTIACRALQLSGCLVLEAGALSAPCLATAAAQQQASCAVWIGSACGAPHAMSLRLWQSAGQPISSPGKLDEVREIYLAGPVRARRGGGGGGRCDAEAIYLPTLVGVFHGLRPLVIVLDTACEPLLRYWHKLSEQTACRIVRPQPPHLANQPTMDRLFGAGAFVEQRIQSVARQVLLDGAHFGLWMSGDGESCELVDERGEPVAPARVLLLLRQYVGRKGERAATVIAENQSLELERQPPAPDLRQYARGNTRQQIAEQAQLAAAPLASDGRGRYWFAGGATPDALATLCLLLALLSESDRPLSEVLDDTPAAK